LKLSLFNAFLAVFLLTFKICYYDNNTTGYNDTLDDFFGVSITKEDIYKYL